MREVVLETLTRHGELDPKTNVSFVVSKDKYFELPVIDDSKLGDCYVSKGNFKEIYRGHSKHQKSVHTAMIIKKNAEDDMHWNIVFINDEQVWVAFEYKNDIDIGEDYGSTVEVANPCRGNIYRISNYIAELLRQMFDIKVPLRDVYKAPPCI